MQWLRTFKSLLLYHFIFFVSADFQFYGGSISFSALSCNISNVTEVRVDAISGWSLGQGPCGFQCTAADINITRIVKDSIFYAANYGNWSLERGAGNGVFFTDINDIVLTNMSQTVIALNEQDSWEQERMLFSISLQWGNSVSGSQDIIYEGRGWHRFLKDVPTKWHLQAKVYAGRRSDTAQPNNSPLSLFRPIYRVQLNRNTSIYIPTIDQEGDLTTCRPSRLVELGDLQTDVNGTEIKENCVFDINADEYLGYHENFSFPVAITVRDLPKHDIHLGDDLCRSYQFSLSSTIIQFLVQVVSSLSGPEFILPVTPFVSRVLIREAATWTTELQAKAESGRNVQKFRVVSRQGEQLLLSQQMDTDQPGVKAAWLTWKPLKQDVGHHIVCVSAIDDNEVMSAEDRCFIIEVIDLAENQTIPLRSLDVNTTLAAPFTLRTTSEVASLAVTCEGVPVSECTISNATLVSSNPRLNYLTTIQARPVTHGTVKVCVTSTLTNGQKVDPLCFTSTVLPPDPCASTPCKYGARCSRSTTDVTDFECHCISAQFYGKDCSQKVNSCINNPCIHGTCLDVHADVFCHCDSGFTGRYCNQNINDCHPDFCGGYGVCIDGVNNFSCQCFPRYNGTECETDTCPSDQSISATCQKDIDPECSPDPCNGRGVCQQGPTCVCRFGYSGDNCENNMTMPATVALVPLMVTNGSTITCGYNNMGTKPCTVRLFVNAPHGTPALALISGTPSLMANSHLGPLEQVTSFERKNLYYFDVTIDGNATSQNDNFLCVGPSQPASSADQNTDTCFDISYTSDPLDDSISVAFFQQNASNRFETPSLPDKSSLLCPVNNSCHLLVYTSSISGKCERILTPDTSLTVFEPKPDIRSSYCVQEVAYQFPDAHTRTVCFQTGLTSFQTRCYDLEIAAVDPNVSVTSSIRCQNGGSCEGNDPSCYCVCTFGFSGSRCEQEDVINDQTLWLIFLPVGMLAILALLGGALYLCLRKRDEQRKVDWTVEGLF